MSHTFESDGQKLVATSWLLRITCFNCCTILFTLITMVKFDMITMVKFLLGKFERSNPNVSAFQFKLRCDCRLLA